MAKGNKSGRVKPRTAALEGPPEELHGKAEDAKAAQTVEVAQATQEQEDTRTSAELEACFMKALERHMGGLEMTDENVRKVLLAMPPDQQRALAAEGEALKRQLLHKKEHEAEAALFRKEMNRNAEARGMPTEADGEHLTKKVLAFLNSGTSDAVGSVPLPYLLAALVSSPYLIKLAVGDAAGGDAQASPSDLDALELRLSSLGVAGAAPVTPPRPPFVRRNLVLLLAHLHARRTGEMTISEQTKRAQHAVVFRTSKLAEMLFRYSLQNRWAKPALAASEALALLTNGLWDVTDAECKQAQAERMAAAGLKMPKLKMSASATDARPGHKVTVKAEVYRQHLYTDEQAAELASSSDSTTTAVEALAAKRAANGLAGGTASLDEPTEGWWLIGEAVRGDGLQLGGTPLETQGQAQHNALVGCVALAATLSQPSMSGEFSFDAPDTPGEYKVMVHVRSTGCVGADIRKKVTFQVLPAIFVKKPATAATPSGCGAGEADDPPPLEESDPPPPLLAAA